VATFTALFDACVLYPAPVRDLLLSVATKEQFRARWTQQIHDEWARHVLANRPDITKEQIERTVALMNEAVPDCLVEHYEALIEPLQLPDPGDRHVLAAAIKCQADVIVTNNLRDFPREVLDRFGIEAQSPDVFLGHLFDLNPTSFCSAVHQQRKRLRNPEYTAEELLDIFYHQGLPLTVSKLKEVVDLL